MRLEYVPKQHTPGTYRSAGPLPVHVDRALQRIQKESGFKNMDKKIMTAYIKAEIANDDLEKATKAESTGATGSGFHPPSRRTPTPKGDRAGPAPGPSADAPTKQAPGPRRRVKIMTGEEFVEATRRAEQRWTRFYMDTLRLFYQKVEMEMQECHALRMSRRKYFRI